MEKIRLFVAIELPDDVKQELEQFQSKLKHFGLQNLKWVAPEGLHITLKFLGPTQINMVPDIRTALDKVSDRFNPVDMGIKGLGAFPSLSRAQVLWVGLSGESGRLQMIAREVDSELITLGFGKEKRGFIPHLTIARMRTRITPADQQALVEAVNNATFNINNPLRIRSISLMQSQLTPVGAIYTRLYQARLSANRSQ